MGFNLFKDEGDGKLKGKGISALLNSKTSRNDLIALFGGVENIPSSVMRAKRPKISKETDGPTAVRSYDLTAPGIERSKDHKLPKAVREAYYVSGRGCQSGALSTFPQAIGRSVVLLYSNPGDTIFDP